MTKPPHFSARKLLLAMLLLPALPATAALRCDHPLGRIAVLQGEVSITGSGAPVQAVLDADICPGDTLDVADRSRVVLRMADGTTLPLDESSAIRLRGLDADGHTLVLELRHGRMNVQAGDAKIRLITQHGRADTEGGGFSVIVMEDQAQLAVARGAVALENATGKLTVRGDEAVFFDAVAAPRPNLLLKPGDAVQWVVRYPAIVDAATAGKNPQLANAAAAYAEGRLVDAEIELDRIDASQRTAEYHVFRANLDLLNGRVADARLAADAALALQPQGASSCAMRAMVALA
ncbi:MAG: FecR domain-containing protein, partial [Rhodocyclaceae bacterium]|nr:FecR domain-containing protein [Rhodocyclaceae bacterium]